MNDPKRLLDEETGAVRDVLVAAREVVAPDPELMARTLVVLGIAEGSIVASGAALEAARQTGAGLSSSLSRSAGLLPSFVLKWLAGGAVLGALGSGVVHQFVRSPADGQPTRDVDPVASVSAAPSSARVVLSASRSEPRDEPVLQTAESPTSPVAEETLPEETLSEEVRMLEVARAAFRRGDVRGAEFALGRYRQRFPAGQLRPEEQILREDLKNAGPPENDAPCRALSD